MAVSFTNNGFTGAVPSFLADMSTLTSLGLVSNSFTGALPINLINRPDIVAVFSSPPVTVCVAGTFVIGSVNTPPQGSITFPAPFCAACPPGEVAPYNGATFCTACPANYFSSGDGVHCSACPANSVSPSGSPSLFNCSCAFGFQQTVVNSSLTCRACSPGTFFDFASLSCAECAAGSFTATSGATTCELCPPSSYNVNSTTCASCPSGSTSPSGSADIAACSCAFGRFPHFDENYTTFACTPCPDGAFCDGSHQPLALADFWHVPGDRTKFYACGAGRCLAETVSSALHSRRLLESIPSEPESNCVAGNEGPVCGVCIHGYTKQGEECKPCDLAKSAQKWSSSRKGGASAGIALGFLLFTVPLFMSPLVPDLVSRMLTRGDSLKRLMIRRLARTSSMADDAADSPKASVEGEHINAVAPTVTTRLAGALAYVLILMEPTRLLVESFQIISSFRSTMQIAWPNLFHSFMARLSFVNLSFFQLPQASCTLPGLGFASKFLAITVSVTALLSYLVFIWGMGSMYAIYFNVDVALRSKFNHRLLFVTLFFFDIIYAPVAEITLSAFSCRDFGKAGTFLTTELEFQCYTPEHYRLRRLGIFWIILYVVGIPASQLALLFHYRVPRAAQKLRRIAGLRAVTELAFRRGIALPDINTAALTDKMLTDDFVNTLYNGVFGSHQNDSSALSSFGKKTVDATSEDDEPLTREEKLLDLERHVRKCYHVHFNLTWEDVPADDNVLRPGVCVPCAKALCASPDFASIGNRLSASTRHSCLWLGISGVWRLLTSSS